jgi:membrane protease YdiL (CAAX protease family)
MQSERVGLIELGMFLCLSALLLPLLFRFRLFSLQKQDGGGEVLSLRSVLLVFAIYIFGSFFLAPAFYKLELWLQLSFEKGAFLPFAQLISMIIVSVIVIIFSVLHQQRTLIWGQKPRFWKGVLIGLACYPIVMLVVNVMVSFLTYFGCERGDQKAIVMLKSLEPYPWLFWSFSIAVFTIVPILEEILFRGFLQNYLKKFGMRAGIILTSCLFAAFHYSASQKASNIELIVGLFLFSYFLGIIYCKQRSLWAPIGMHMILNFLSLLGTFV